MTTENHYVECDCGSASHVIRFMYDEADEKLGFPPELYMEVQIVQYRNIFERIWTAIKYIFKTECKYGHWDCVLINTNEANKMIKLLERFSTEVEKYEESKKTQ